MTFDFAGAISPTILSLDEIKAQIEAKKASKWLRKGLRSVEKDIWANDGTNIAISDRAILGLVHEETASLGNLVPGSAANILKVLNDLRYAKAQKRETERLLDPLINDFVERSFVVDSNPLNESGKRDNKLPYSGAPGGVKSLDVLVWAEKDGLINYGVVETRYLRRSVQKNYVNQFQDIGGLFRNLKDKTPSMKLASLVFCPIHTYVWEKGIATKQETNTNIFRIEKASAHPDHIVLARALSLSEKDQIADLENIQSALNGLVGHFRGHFDAK